MSRGIERRSIFIDEEDYADFRERIAVWLHKSGGKCLAWCLMPNHFHFLVLRGARPLSEMMHHVMTGYAINFNLRHRRAGHLFQNRYKAIICDLEEYLMELAPYIHLNPLRARLVKDVAGLGGYKWCGHAAVVAGVADEVLDRSELLIHFGEKEQSAVEKYSRIMAERARDAVPRDPSSGEGSVLQMFRAGEKVFSDQRILGGSGFTEAVLKSAGEAMVIRKKSRAEVLAAVEAVTGLTKEAIFRHTHERRTVHARAIYCYLCAQEAGSSGSELMGELGMSAGAVSKLVVKGRILAKALN
jgi:REP element-mobilizing transposase RayT